MKILAFILFLESNIFHFVFVCTKKMCESFNEIAQNLSLSSHHNSVYLDAYVK